MIFTGFLRSLELSNYQYNKKIKCRIVYHVQESCLSEWLGDQMASLESISQFYIVLIVSLVLCAFTEVTSNVATASIFLPIVGSVVRI